MNKEDWPIELKPMMRVVTKNNLYWIIVPNVAGQCRECEDDLVAISQGGWIEIGFASKEDLNYNIAEVYGPPEYTCDLLKPDCTGKLLWSSDYKWQKRLELKQRIEALRQELKALDEE